MIGLTPALALALTGAATLSGSPPTMPPAGSEPTAAAPAALAPAMPQTAPALPTEAQTTPTPHHEDHTEHDTIVVSSSQPKVPGDPFQSVNATSFAITQDVDVAVIAPVAMAYKQVMPEPIRDGLRNALRNVNEPVIVLNYLLQFKPGKAAETVGRFVINSTVGMAGLFDMAKRAPINLPRRPNGFAYTMGYYGIKPGPFFFLPLIGPTTLRDALGGAVDRMLVPMALGKPFNQLAYSVPTSLLSTLNRRIEVDAEIHRLRDDSDDPYAAFRANYLQKRQAEIDALHGKRKSLSDGPPAVNLPEPAPAQAAPKAP